MPARLTSTIHGDDLIIEASGQWVADHAGSLEHYVLAVTQEKPHVARVAIDLSRIERFDTVGAWMVEKLTRDWQAAGPQVRLVGLNPRWQDLINEVTRANRAPPRPQPADRPVHDFLAALGKGVVDAGDDLLAVVNYLGAMVAVMLRLARRPGKFRLTSLVHHLDRVGFRAVPIIVLITFLVGAIIAQQGIFHFRNFGAELYVVDMVGILVLRELGVLLVAIMIAGRSGSAYTAELGSMKMREEMDALRVMGFDPVEVLLLPRVLALVLALPLLTFIGSMAALLGGALTAQFYGGISLEVFSERLKEAITLGHFTVGLVKAPAMALVIGLIACVEGLRVKGSAESLGAQTTSSVVKSIFMVIVLDGLFAMFFAAIKL